MAVFRASEEFQGGTGNAFYHDNLTASSPVVVAGGVWTTIPCAEGPGSNIDNLPETSQNLWDSAGNQFDFEGTPDGAGIHGTVDFQVQPTVAHQKVHMRLAVYSPGGSFLWSKPAGFNEGPSPLGNFDCEGSTSFFVGPRIRNGSTNRVQWEVCSPDPFNLVTYSVYVERTS